MPIPHPLPEPLVELVAQRFRLIGEPMRIRLLDRLRDGEQSVGELTDALGAIAAERLQAPRRAASGRHRQPPQGRQPRRLRDRRRVVFALCEMVCGGLSSSSPSSRSSSRAVRERERTAMMELWQTEWCPASRRVRQRLTELDVDLPRPPGARRQGRRARADRRDRLRLDPRARARRRHRASSARRDPRLARRAPPRARGADAHRAKARRHPPPRVPRGAPALSLHPLSTHPEVSR